MIRRCPNGHRVSLAAKQIARFTSFSFKFSFSFFLVAEDAVPELREIMWDSEKQSPRGRMDCPAAAAGCDIFRLENVDSEKNGIALFKKESSGAARYFEWRDVRLF